MATSQARMSRIDGATSQTFRGNPACAAPCDNIVASAPDHIRCSMTKDALGLWIPEQYGLVHSHGISAINAANSSKENRSSAINSMHLCWLSNR